jgi:NADH:ubiquinone reductase (H+-translocating)
MLTYRKIVIVGGGFGGLQVARHLHRMSAEIILLDKTNHHLFQPLLYEVASAALSPGDIAVPIREILSKQRNTVVLMGEVAAVDKERRCIRMANGELISYDCLVLAVGARHSYFGHDEWEVLAPGIKTLLDALTIRERILKSFEMAERSDSFSAQEKYLSFVVIGAGPTGVEIAGAISEIAYQTMIRNFRRVNTSKTKIYLVEGAPEVLPPFPRRLGERAHRDLRRMGVQVVTGAMVTDISEEGVHLGERFIHARNVIWAAGNQASPLLKTLEVPLDRQGRVMVEPDCTIADHPEIFVIGDAAHFKGRDGKPLPGIAPTAIQQGRYVAKILRRGVPPGKRKPFKYLDKGMVATIGKNKAVAVVRGHQLAGSFAWLMWAFIHIVYLIGYRNRILVMVHWLFQYCTGQRGARLIQEPIDEQHP